MLGGNLDYAMMEPVFSTAQMRQGRLRILAVSTRSACKPRPELPTFIEAGIPDRHDRWWAAMVPSADAQPVIEQLSKWFNQGTGSDDAKKFLNGFASDPGSRTPEEAQATVPEGGRRLGPLHGDRQDAAAGLNRASRDGKREKRR